MAWERKIGSTKLIQSFWAGKGRRDLALPKTWFNLLFSQTTLQQSQVRCPASNNQDLFLEIQAKQEVSQLNSKCYTVKDCKFAFVIFPLYKLPAHYDIKFTMKTDCQNISAELLLYSFHIFSFLWTYESVKFTQTCFKNKISE